MNGHGKTNKGRKDNRDKRYHHRYQPRRGGPGILLTCESGREKKCERQGMEIITHYYFDKDAAPCTKGEDTKTDTHPKESESGETGSGENNDETSGTSLTLEEEIAMLKKGASTEQVLQSDSKSKDKCSRGNGKKKSNTGPFDIYDTGCRGTVFVMYRDPNMTLHAKKNEDAETAKEGGEDVIDNDDDGDSSRANKKRKVDVTTCEEKRDTSINFDAFKLVKHVMEDAKDSVKSAPSSRFVTRMIPIQATCFANLDEIKETAKFLIETHLLPLSARHLDDSNSEKTDKKPSFGISFKKRNCSCVTRDQCISAVADLVDGDKFCVDLKDPDYTILIEICRTLVGMSVVPNFRKNCQNFNLLQIREKTSNEEDLKDGSESK